jgi:hypothetical protein
MYNFQCINDCCHFNFLYIFFNNLLLLKMKRIIHIIKCETCVNNYFFFHNSLNFNENNIVFFCKYGDTEIKNNNYLRTWMKNERKHYEVLCTAHTVLRMLYIIFTISNEFFHSSQNRKNLLCNFVIRERVVWHLFM